MTRGMPAAVLAGMVVTACSASGPTASEEPEVATMNLTSSSFTDDGAIPSEYTCDGADVSPPLAWDDVPGGTDSFALIVTDPDAGGFVHWMLTEIPGDARELPEGAGDGMGTPGPNDFGRVGWGGPCPPSGEHRYVFTLYALGSQLSGATDTDAVRDAAESSAIGRATLTGVYSRR